MCVSRSPVSYIQTKYLSECRVPPCCTELAKHSSAKTRDSAGPGQDCAVLTTATVVAHYEVQLAYQHLFTVRCRSNSCSKLLVIKF